jgi:hypothetical protein
VKKDAQEGGRKNEKVEENVLIDFCPASEDDLRRDDVEWKFHFKNYDLLSEKQIERSPRSYVIERECTHADNRKRGRRASEPR